MFEPVQYKVEERMRQAQDEEDWDLYEEIAEELHVSWGCHGYGCFGWDSIVRSRLQNSA